MADELKPNEKSVDRRAFLGSLVASSIALPLLPNIAFGEKKVPGRFQDRVILITGATSGIGAATAMGFAKEGGKVFFCGRRKDKGNEVENAIRKAGGEATYFQADVRVEKEVKDFMEACVGHYGSLDIAYNNAAVVTIDPGLMPAIPTEFFENIFRTNTEGVFLSMKYEIPIMQKQGHGIILNMASIAARNAAWPFSTYGASKAAIVSLTKSAAMEFGKFNIRINSISPDLVATEEALNNSKKLGVDLNTWTRNALHRLIRMDEVVDTILMLCSKEASALYGTDFELSFGV